MAKHFRIRTFNCARPREERSLMPEINDWINEMEEHEDYPNFEIVSGDLAHRSGGFTMAMLGYKYGEEEPEPEPDERMVLEGAAQLDDGMAMLAFGPSSEAHILSQNPEPYELDDDGTETLIIAADGESPQTIEFTDVGTVSASELASLINEEAVGFEARVWEGHLNGPNGPNVAFCDLHSLTTGSESSLEISECSMAEIMGLPVDQVIYGGDGFGDLEQQTYFDPNEYFVTLTSLETVGEDIAPLAVVYTDVDMIVIGSEDVTADSWVKVKFEGIPIDEPHAIDPPPWWETINNFNGNGPD